MSSEEAFNNIVLNLIILQIETFRLQSSSRSKSLLWFMHWICRNISGNSVKSERYNSLWGYEGQKMKSSSFVWQTTISIKNPFQISSQILAHRSSPFSWRHFSGRKNLTEIIIERHRFIEFDIMFQTNILREYTLQIC